MRNAPHWKWWLARIFGEPLDYGHGGIRYVGALWRGRIYVRRYR